MCIIYSGVYHLQIAVNCIIYRQTLCRLFLTVKSNLNQLAGELGGQLEIKRPELLSQSKSNVCPLNCNCKMLRESGNIIVLRTFYRSAKYNEMMFICFEYFVSLLKPNNWVTFIPAWFSYSLIWRPLQ